MIISLYFCQIELFTGKIFLFTFLHFLSGISISGDNPINKMLIALTEYNFRYLVVSPIKTKTDSFICLILWKVLLMDFFKNITS